MASSSSTSSSISFESESTREATPEHDPNAEEWDFQTWSEDDESLTDGEDLQLLLGGELDEDDEDDMSWEGDFFFSEEEVDSSSTEEDSVAGDFLLGGSSEDDDDDDEEVGDSSGFSSDSGGDDGGSDDDGSNDDSDANMAPPIKRRRQEDGPEPKNDDGSSFKFLPVAPVVLFDNNAPPLSKVIMQIQPYSAKSASKRKRASDIAAPRAQTKARKMTVRKIRKEAGPSSIDQEAPIVNQADIVEISSGEEPARQENPTPEAPEDPLMMGLNLSELLSFDPASVGSAILEADDHQPQPTGVASQLLRIKGLLSAPIDALVQDSNAVVSGEDKDDEAVTAEADRVRLQVVAAIDDFLQ
ncbi:nucleolin 2-like [Panicum hallii]|uniref:nucleolin 2-like n=1 Tax=Panicum hallii TaxID=206008 RepID=UPI000DF4CF63|nr:nucleolin 2-like [Panicum hallii]